MSTPLGEGMTERMSNRLRSDWLTKGERTVASIRADVDRRRLTAPSGLRAGWGHVAMGGDFF
jgi:hypothetical protein